MTVPAVCRGIATLPWSLLFEYEPKTEKPFFGCSSAYFRQPENRPISGRFFGCHKSRPKPETSSVFFSRFFIFLPPTRINRYSVQPTWYKSEWEPRKNDRNRPSLFSSRCTTNPDTNKLLVYKHTESFEISTIWPTLVVHRPIYTGSASAVVVIFKTL